MSFQLPGLTPCTGEGGLTVTAGAFGIIINIYFSNCLSLKERKQKGEKGERRKKNQRYNCHRFASVRLALCHNVTTLFPIGFPTRNRL